MSTAYIEVLTQYSKELELIMKTLYQESLLQTEAQLSGNDDS